MDIAMTTDRGGNDLRRVDRLRLRRINVGGRAGVPLIRAQLAWAAGLDARRSSRLTPIHRHRKRWCAEASPRNRLAGMPSYTPGHPPGRAPRRTRGGRSHHERVAASLARAGPDRHRRGRLDRGRHGVEPESWPDAHGPDRHATAVADRVTAAAAARRSDVRRLRRRPDHRPRPDDELRPIEAVVRGRPVVGRLFGRTTNRLGIYRLDAGYPGLGGHRRAHRRAAVRRRGRPLDRDPSLHGGRRIATLGEPRHPRSPLHVRRQGGALHARRRLRSRSTPAARARRS